MLIDLQLHSTFSDGYLSPEDLARFIAGQGVRVAALTDHNSIAGLSRFRKACTRHGIKMINGIELYVTLRHKSFNVLWLNFPDNDPAIQSIIHETQSRRKAKFRQILEKFNRSGFKIKIDDMLARFPDQYIPVNKIVDLITEAPANKKLIEKILKVKNPREEMILSHFFYNKKFASLGNSHINIERLARLKKKIGGHIIVNHPGKTRFLKHEDFAFLKKLGIDGIEVLSPHHSLGAVMHAQHVALEHGFIMSGGSDFHRHEGMSRPIQDAWQYYRIDSSLLEGIEKIISKH